jgi:hypothetical protein
MKIKVVKWGTPKNISKKMRTIRTREINKQYKTFWIFQSLPSIAMLTSVKILTTAPLRLG